ncbi:MAG: TonB-dependent receptor [Halioglobus sp.]
MKFLGVPLLALATGTAMATEQPVMEHVLVSVPLHKKTAETALPVTVLLGEDLRRAASSTIGETLSNSPGLANASFGPGVGQPVIRGQQGARVTVLQNGTSSADASNLSADHAVAVEAMLADSIEVLRGPATLLYGGGAIGGVVNVVDNRIPTTLEEGVSGGVEYRHDTASNMDTVVVRADLGSGAFAFHLDGLYRDWDDLEIPGPAAREDEHGDGHDVEHETTDGYIANTDGLTRNATLGGSYHFEEGFLGLAVSRLENTYGIPGGAHEHEDDEAGDEAEDEGGGVRLDVEQTRYDAALHWHEPLPGLEVLRGFLTFTDYEHSEIEPDGEIGTVYSNETWETRLELVHEPLGPLHGVFGLQAKNGEFSALGEEAFVPETDSLGLGLFLLEDLHWDRWTYEAGFRLDHDERSPLNHGVEDRDFLGFSVSGSIQWELNSEWMLGMALSRAERAPATEELYSNVAGESPEDWIVHAATGAIELGDPDLDSEVSNNLDLSMHWSLGSHFVDVTLFYNDFSDYINLLNTGLEVDRVPVLRYTQDDAEFYGLEIDTEFALMALADGQLALGLFGDSIRGELDTGGDVPRLPPARLGARLNWSSDRATLWAQVIDAAAQDRPGDNERASEAYTRWDMGADYLFSRGGSEFTLSLDFKNITDEEIRLSTSFLRDVAPEAGRSVELGLRLLL